jgi:hypothetical protein
MATTPAADDILYDVEFMFLYDCGVFVPQIEAEERKQLVVERLRDAQVSNRYIDVINNWFHVLASLGVRAMRVFAQRSPVNREPLALLVRLNKELGTGVNGQKNARRLSAVSPS